MILRTSLKYLDLTSVIDSDFKYINPFKNWGHEVELQNELRLRRKRCRTSWANNTRKRANFSKYPGLQTKFLYYLAIKRARGTCLLTCFNQFSKQHGTCWLKQDSNHVLLQYIYIYRKYTRRCKAIDIHQLQRTVFMGFNQGMPFWF